MPPIGLALNIEVTNEKSTPTLVRAYAGSLEMEDGSWSRIYSLPTDLEHALYDANGFSYEKCYRLEAEPNLFDRVAKSKILTPKETISGWVFFEWSPELRDNRKIRRLKLEVENTQGEAVHSVFDFIVLMNETNDRSGKSLASEKGAGDLYKSELRIKSRSGSEDLSRLQIRPFSPE